MRPLFLLLGFLWLGAGGAAEPGRLWVVDPQGLSPAEQALTASIQGHLNRTQATVWFKGRGAATWVLEDLRKEGWTLETSNSPWSLLENFRARFRGFVTCQLEDPSFNAATSLAGSREAVVVGASLRQRMTDLGWTELFDARGWRDADVFERFGPEFTRGIAIHQPINKPLHLRDLAIARRAFTFFDVTSQQRRDLVQKLGPLTRVLGWGLDERDFVGDVSAGGGVVIPADWALNLSALQHLPAPVPERPRPAPPAPLRDEERVVCFVISDGDNIQWLLNGFVEAPGFWASPHRGRFAVTWELAPSLAQVAPRVLTRLYRTATPADDFIAGPSGSGYYFPSLSPTPIDQARATAQSLAPAQLGLVTVLNANGSLDAADPIVEQPEISGVLYKDYAPYNRFRGTVRWHAGKPIVSYRYLLWEERRSDGSLRPDWLPDAVAQAIGQLPVGTGREADRFALVNVHAWSFRNSGGPMGAIARTIAALPPQVRVVTATEFFRLLKPSR
jgi:hypothetical protein